VASGIADSCGGLQIELLGPVEAWMDGKPVALGGQRPRALFALLALMGGRVVTNERLIDELWGEDPPARARDSLQMHVSRLRKALTEAGAGAGRLVSHAGGYRLDVQPGDRDVDRWQLALGRARRAREAGELAAARAGIEEAVRLWRGVPLGGVAANEVLAAERARLEEERLGATIEGIELDLELGRHGELLAQLEALVITHPFKERLVELQMLALYRSGRQADALAAFHAARARFVDELGIEPSQQLRELHEDILKHADELSPPARAASAPTLEARPPPAALRTFGERRLPVPPNRTIGREHALGALAERLRAGSVRLVTLTGPGGVGKTRLALEAARAVQADFADGACFVSLAAVQRPEEVPAALVDSLAISPLTGESAGAAVERFLAAKHLLLLADNFEHLLPAARFIGGLLGACPALTVLATSREPLTLHAEERYPVSPLALPALGTPEDAEALAGVDAVVLFCERARAHDPSFELGDANAASVAEICRRVDGLPLAIELAAARCALLSAAEIAERLDQALGALGAGARDAPARQQTLRATIDWSHDLLGDAEKACFARFAVFAGGATVEAAETITAAVLETLDGLVAKSLLVRRQHAHAATRLVMLETVRAYAAERFAAAGGEQAVRERHYRFFLALAQRHGSDRALLGAGRREHLARLDAEIDNLHAALAWAVHQPDAQPALAMCAALGQYWWMRDRYADAMEWIDRALRMPGADAHPALRVRALCGKGLALWPLGREAELSAVMAEAEAVGRALGDPLILSRTLQLRARYAAFAGAFDVGAAIADEASELATAAEDDWAIAMAAYATAMAASTIVEMRERAARAAALLDEVGNVYHLAMLLAASVYGELCLGSDRDAKELVDRATPLACALDDPQLWANLHGNSGLTALLTGETDAAQHAFCEQLGLCRELVAPRFAGEGLRGLAAVAAVRNDSDRAARLAGAAAAHRGCAPQDEVDARLDATFIQPARRRQGADAWDAAARDGGTLSLEDAITYALQQPR
jgi:predicted ATPase/DNA-binding SARP family transcriptional activator